MNQLSTFNYMGTNNNVKGLPMTFSSKDHIRFQNGLQVAGPHGGIVHRLIKVDLNEDGCEGYQLEKGDGYIVTIYNMDGAHPLWGGNLQMTPKPMRIVEISPNSITLRGYPVLAQSPIGWIEFPGQDYGLSIYFEDSVVSKCILHLHDRGVDIEYI